MEKLTKDAHTTAKMGPRQNQPTKMTKKTKTIYPDIQKSSYITNQAENEKQK